MGVKINFDKRAIIQHFDGVTEKMIPQLTEIIAGDANQYVKVASHALEASMNVHSDFAHGIIKWWTPYAARQFWKIKTAYTDVNPNASWKWFFVAKAKHLAKWTAQAKALFKALEGGDNG